MDTYTFSLVLSQVDETTQDLEDKLFEAGCSDSLINFRNGTVYLDFDRRAKNIEDAIVSAIQAVERAPLGAKVVRVAPDNYVSESEIAKRLDMKRQTVSLWVKGQRRAAEPFPKPLLKLSEKSPLWRWYDIVEWLFQQNQLEDETIIESAKFIENINGALGERDKHIRQFRHALLKKLEGHHHTSHL